MFIILLLLHIVYAGTLWPVSIQLSIANRYEYADYTFTMIPDTTIPIGGEIQIIFPQQYLYGLGIDLVLSNTCSHVCTITGFLVRFYMENEILSNQTLILQINNIKNPESKGGTGNFIVRSKLGQNVFDENLIFGTIGIADYALDFNSLILTIDKNSTNIVNQNALYNFYIKSPIDLPENFYIQITSPLISDLTNCSIIEYNNTILNATITCEQGIIIKGFPQVNALYTFGIQVNFKNPPYAQITNSFRVCAFRENTKMVYAWRSAIQGILIQPSEFINITLIPGSNKSAIISDYTLKMKLGNIVPSTGSIIVQLPLNFQLAYGYDYIYVKSGITSDSLNITYTLYQFTINNFQEIPQYSDIEIIFRVVNPQLSGQSQSFIVQTTYDGTNIIEQCNNNLNVVIQSSITYSPVIGILSIPYASSNTNLQFEIKSIRNLATKIIIYFGSDWLYQTTTFTCLLDSTTSTSCVLDINKLTIIFPLTISGTKTVSINGLLKAPIYALDQFITYDTYDNSNIDIESGSIKIIVNPKLDSTATFKWIGKGLSTSTVNLYATLQVKFTNTVLIPAQTIIQTDTSGGTTDPSTDPTTTDPTTPTDPTTTPTDPTTTPTDPTTTDPTTDPTTPTTPTIPTLTPPTPNGEIWIQFGPLLTWIDDLGITTLYCLTDLLPIDTLEIDCKLYKGSDTSKPEIRILNFKEIAANTVINLKITGIQNPQLSPIEISIFSGIRQYSNRIAYDYATISIPLNTIVPLTDAIVTSSFSTSTSSVNQLYNLVFQPGFTAPISIGSIIRIQLPGYENGFVQNTTKCTIDSTEMVCDKYLKIDWIEIPLTVGATTTSTITLSNLKWPSTSTQIGYINWIAFTTNLEIQRAIVQGGGGTMFPAPNANDFLEATITQYQSGRGYPGQIFRFQFSVNNDIQQGATMRIQFPNEFTLRASTPTPTCNGYDFDSIELNAIPAKTIFEIVCIGIKTPNNPPDNESDGWSVYIYIDGRILNQRQNFYSYFYSNIFTQGTINILQLQAVPLNINEIATYTIIFQPENSLLIDSQIHITFPSTNFEELPYPPNLADCNIEGGVNSFQSCLLNGSSFIIILNKIYENGIIQFQINNIQNPSILISDGFIIKTYYDNILIDSTDESTLLNRTITYYNQPLKLIINSLTFQPQNQGIKAIYKFNLSTDNTINGSIVIIFPNTYDQRLGDNIKVFINDLRITYTINNRILQLPEQQYQAKQNSILIEIQNIINPNIDENSNTGEFRIGIRQNDRYTHYNGSVGVLEMLSPPGWLYLQNIKLNNQYSRWQSQYIFNMILYNKIPSNGYLQLEFTEDYEISDQTAQCNFITCKFQNNVLKAYTDSINGQILLKVMTENPLNEILIKQYQLQSKDDRKIIEQSYPNLDPFQFQFNYSGPLIYVNEDKDIIIPQGSESSDLLFRVDYPMSLNLTFKHTLTGDFIVTPKDISFPYTTLSTTFRVQIPTTLSVGTYYIYWGTYGEKSNPIYTPIKKSKVIVIQQIIQFSITALYPIPNGGNSLIMVVSTNNAPYDKTTITITNNDKTFYFTAGEQIDTKITLTFQLGINKQEFRVQQNYTELIRQTQLDILNEDDRLIFYTVDNQLYTIPQQQTIKYIDATNIPPKLNKINVATITQYSAIIDIEINQVSEAFYMYCLNKTKSPTISELLSLGPPLYITSLSQYGQLNILSKSQVELKLYAQTDYSFYIVLRNQEGLLSDIYNLNFTSKNRSKIAQFTLSAPFGANQAQIVTLMNNIAFILSLPSWKIQQKITYAANSRLLSTTTLQLYIIPFNDTDNYPQPKDLISKITSDSQFKRLMKIYLPSISISGITQAIAEIPIISSSTLKKSYLYDCEIDVTLTAVGYVYAIASSDEQSTPFQIFKGLNNVNIKVPNANQHILKQQSFNISNLEPNKTYSIQLIAASDLPEYPDLSDIITTLKCTTLKLEDRAPQIISFSILLIMNIMILFIY